MTCKDNQRRGRKEAYGTDCSRLSSKQQQYKNVLLLLFKFSEFAEYLFSLRFSRRFSITQMANMAVLWATAAAAAATKAQTSENDGLAFTVMKKKKLWCQVGQFISWKRMVMITRQRWQPQPQQQQQQLPTSFRVTGQSFWRQLLAVNKTGQWSPEWRSQPCSRKWSYSRLLPDCKQVDSCCCCCRWKIWSDSFNWRWRRKMFALDASQNRQKMCVRWEAIIISSWRWSTVQDQHQLKLGQLTVEKKMKR